MGLPTTPYWLDQCEQEIGKLPEEVKPTLLKANSGEVRVVSLQFGELVMELYPVRDLSTRDTIRRTAVANIVTATHEARATYNLQDTAVVLATSVEEDLLLWDQSEFWIRDHETAGFFPVQHVIF